MYEDSYEESKSYFLLTDYIDAPKINYNYVTQQYKAFYVELINL